MDFRVDVFKGIRPRASSRLLPLGEGQTASNLRLGTGALEAWRGITEGDDTCAGGIESLHRMRNDGFNPFWLQFTSDVDVAKGPVPNDDIERVYYTGTALSEPRMTTKTLAIPTSTECAPHDYYLLGVPAPAAAPAVTGSALPSAAVTGNITGMTVKSMKADFTIQNHLPSNVDGWFMGGETGYDTAGVIRSFGFNFFVGQEVSVASVVDANTITVSDANGATYLVAGNDDTRVIASGAPFGQSNFRTGDTGTSRHGHFRFYLPNALRVTCTAHGLLAGDKIRLTSVLSPMTVNMTQPAGVGTPIFYGSESDNGAGTAQTNTWPAAPVSVTADAFYNAGASSYPFVDVYADSTGTAGSGTFSSTGSLAWTLIERGGVSYENIVEDTTARVYVYTYVSTLGEEGPPSPPSDEVTITTDGTVTVGTFTAAPSTHRSITARRIYRATTGTDQTVFEYVAEIAVATASYVDSIADLDLGEVLQTTDWDPPDEDMIGIIALPNGMLAGFVGKTLCFSEPYYPHAWPTKYQIAVPHEIIGLGILPSGVAVLTRGGVWLAAGDHPAAMSLRHIMRSQSCVSKLSIVSTLNSVIYACPDGLASIGTDGFKLISEAHFMKKEWNDRYTVTSIRGFWYDDKYFGFHDDGCFIFDPYDETVGWTETDVSIDTGFLDEEEDTLYIVETHPLTPVIVAGADTGTNTTKAMSSPDGITWTLRTTPNINGLVTAAAWRNAQFITPHLKFYMGQTNQAGASNQTCMSASDGITWAAVNQTTPNFLSNEVTGIMHAPAPNFSAYGRLVAYGSSGGSLNFSYSDDAGVTWSAQQQWIESAECLAAVWAGDRFVTASSGGSIMTSPTCIGASASNSFTRTISSFFTIVKDRSRLLYDEARDRVILMAASDVYYSDDKGVSFTHALSSSGLEDICYSEDLDTYVLCFSSGIGFDFRTSTDGGATWSAAHANPVGSAAQYSGVARSEELGLFIAVSRTTTLAQVATSPDGVTWTSRAAAASAEWESVAAGGTLAIAPISTWDTDEDNPLTYTWKSGKVVCPYLLNPGAARVEADDYPVTLRLYNDQDTLVITKTVNDDEAFRLPSGYLTNWFEVELESSETVRTLHVAETMEELLPG